MASNSRRRKKARTKKNREVHRQICAPCTYLSRPSFLHSSSPLPCRNAILLPPKLSRGMQHSSASRFESITRVANSRPIYNKWLEDIGMEKCTYQGEREITKCVPEAVPKKSHFLEGSCKYPLEGTFTKEFTFPKGMPEGLPSRKVTTSRKEHFFGTASRWHS